MKKTDKKLTNLQFIDIYIFKKTIYALKSDVGLKKQICIFKKAEEIKKNRSVYLKKRSVSKSETIRVKNERFKIWNI